MRFFKLERRGVPPSIKIKLSWLALTLLLMFSITAVFIIISGANPLVAYQELFFSPFRNQHAITEIFVTTTPLLFIALGLSISYKSRFWNIGGEGQFYAGALFVTAAVLVLKGIGLPAPLFIMLLIIFGFLGGAVWATIAGILKIKFGINEIIATLMLNFIMIYFLAYLLYGPWMDPISVMPQSEFLPPSARIPTLVDGTRLHSGILFFILVLPVVSVILNRTNLGYQIKSVGGSLKAARYAGMDLRKVMLMVVILSGGLAGLAGMVEVSGVFYRLRDDISPGYGYTAILVALIGKNDPKWVAVVAFLFGVLMVGGFEMQTATGIPSALSLVTHALIFIGVICAEALSQYKIKLRFS